MFGFWWIGNQKLEIWKRTDGTIVGRSLDDGQSINDQNEFDGSVSQQEVRKIIAYLNLILYCFPYSLSIGLYWIILHYMVNYILKQGTVYLQLE